jgi:hypothetical protein
MGDIYNKKRRTISKPPYTLTNLKFGLPSLLSTKNSLIFGGISNQQKNLCRERSMFARPSTHLLPSL